MKINWGTGIVIAFVCFISFVLFFVFKATLNKDVQHQLVTKDYYKQELAHQEEIDAERNTVVDRMQPTVSKVGEGLQITFPAVVENDKLIGKVSLYRPSDEHLDFDLPLRLSNTHLLVPDNRLSDGRWDLKIYWKYNGKNYLYKEAITY